MIYKLSEEYFVRPLVESDIEGAYPSWFNDQAVCEFNSHGKFFRNMAYFREFITGLNNEKQVVWAVCHVKDGHIGNVSLQALSFIDRTAEFAIIIGDKRHWGKGVGKLAGLQLLRHGFDKLNLHKVYCGTAAGNTGMQHLAATLGMKLEGTRREHLFLNGEWVDLLEFGVLADEFRALK
jgi:RimJ/RimL family protein N-acetyltransferase